MLFRNTVIPNTWGYEVGQIVRHPVTKELGLVRQVWMFSLVVDWPWGQVYCPADGLEIVPRKRTQVESLVAKFLPEAAA